MFRTYEKPFKGKVFKEIIIRILLKKVNIYAPPEIKLVTATWNKKTATKKKTNLKFTLIFKKKKKKKREKKENCEA
jgi:ribonuclease BN (tRNA processing enzyme)